MLIFRDHLIQSALGRNAAAELRGSPEERSQGGAAMPRREEASRRCLTGLRMGRAGGRASPLRAKSVSPAPLWGSSAAEHAVIGGQTVAVRHAIMPGAWRSNPTDEVPQRPRPPGGVTVGHKYDMKSRPYALVAGTMSPWPRLQGCQQRQSRSPQGTQRQHRSQSRGQGKPRGKVSPRIQATQWPAGTSSWQTFGPLRNIPLSAQISPRTASVR
jgi:hypothetical protein